MEFVSPEILMTILVGALLVIGFGFALFIVQAHHAKYSKVKTAPNDVCTEDTSSCYDTEACNTCTMNNVNDDK